MKWKFTISGNSAYPGFVVTGLCVCSRGFEVVERVS